MNSSASLVYSRLFLPFPLPVSAVAAFLTRLASSQDRFPVVLETRADHAGVVHLLGCEATRVHDVRCLLTDLIPGTIMAGLDGLTRPPMIVTGHVLVDPPRLPLTAYEPERVLLAVFSALGRRHPIGEAVTVQLVLGAGVAPRATPAKVDDPAAGLWTAVTRGRVAASAETRNRIRERQAHFGFDVVLRVGAAAATADKRRRLVGEILSAFAVSEGPGSRLRYRKEDPNRLNIAPLTRRGVVRLSVPELVALTAWPAGEQPLPGMPPLHPKLVRADASVHTGDRSFATSLFPGDPRRLGVSAEDMLHHGWAAGPTGSGKSQLLQLIAEAQIRSGNGLLVLDPKAEMHDFLLARVPKERWEDVYLIDGTDAQPLGFNPLDATGRDPDVVADGILSVFEKVFRDGWGFRSADIFSAGLRLLTRTADEAAPHTLLDLPRLWTDTAFRRSLTARIQDDPGLAGFWAWYESLKPAAQMNAVAAPMNKLRRVLLSPMAVRILGQRRPTLHLRDVFRERKIVLLPLNEGLLGPIAVELIGTLAIAATWAGVQSRAAEPGRATRPGMVIVDEADRFMHLPGVSLVDALARSRSHAVSWWLATQSFFQLTKDMQVAVKTNAKTKVVFRIESDDDARTIARLAPNLTDEDFMSLGKYEIYARLVADGITTNWALAKTLPPTPEVANPLEVRRVSRETHLPEATDEHPTPITPEPPPTSPPTGPASTSGAPIGRVRRRPS